MQRGKRARFIWKLRWNKWFHNRVFSSKSLLYSRSILSVLFSFLQLRLLLDSGHYYCRIHPKCFFLTAHEYVFEYYNAIKTYDTVMGFKNIPLVHFSTLFGLLLVMFVSGLNSFNNGFWSGLLASITLELNLDWNHFLANVYYSSILIRIK